MVEDEIQTKPSFSAGRRVVNVFHFCLGVVAALALVAMANYLASGYFKRFNWASNAKWTLAPQTISVLDTITNDINVTIFFDTKGDKTAEVYALSSELLKEYELRNHHIKVKTIDYIKYPGAGQEFLNNHKQFSTLKDKDFVLFENNGQTRLWFAKDLSDFNYNEMISGQSTELRRTSFKGEMLFSASLAAVTHARPMKAYFLAGHGEHDPDNTSQEFGYGKFAALLSNEGNMECKTLSLNGTNEVPADSLLIVAGAGRAQLLETEQEKINNFLKQGGRMLVLAGNMRVSGDSGIEAVLDKWGLNVGTLSVIDDDEHTVSAGTLVTTNLNAEHEITKPLLAEELPLELILPRPISQSKEMTKSADAPRLKSLVRSSPNAVAQFATGYPAAGGKKESFVLAASVEQGGIKGVNAERGATRIVVIGDSLCFDNLLLDAAANHYFANSVVNWLAARPTVLLDKLAPRPIKSYQVIMTSSQMKMVQWILLGAIPGAALLLGGLVWLRRRS